MLDSFYIKGSSNHPCQDYAAHTDKIAALSDGCSSVKKTEVGAMLLVESRLKVCNSDDVIERAKSACRVIDIHETCLYGTLHWIHYNGMCYHFLGDGFLYKDGSLIERSYEDNAPYYPIYGSSIQNRGEEKLLLGELPSWCASPAKEICMIFSDGLGSFVDSAGKPISPVDILSYIIDIKNRAPGFLKRSCSHFFKKVCVQNGWTSTDDFSVIGWLSENSTSK